MTGVAVFAPTPLVTVTAERSASGDDQLHIHLGGQGVWVARMIARVGVPVTLCTVFGGETGDVARHLLGSDGIDVRSVGTVAWNGGYVHDRRSGRREVLAEVGPGPLLRHELDDLYSTTLTAALDRGVCVLTGTHLYPVLADDVYRRLAHDLRANGVSVISDLSGAQLVAALGGGVSIAKVSEEELVRDGWIEPSASSDPRLDRVIDRLLHAGAEAVVVSRGEHPAQVSIGGVRYEVVAPVMEAVDHRGAGDAMTGLLAAAIARAAPTEQVLADAAAAGAATVVRHGYASGTREAVEALARKVRVRRVSGP